MELTGKTTKAALIQRLEEADAAREAGRMKPASSSTKPAAAKPKPEDSDPSSDAARAFVTMCRSRRDERNERYEREEDDEDEDEEDSDLPPTTGCGTKNCMCRKSIANSPIGSGLSPAKDSR